MAPDGESNTPDDGPPEPPDERVAEAVEQFIAALDAAPEPAQVDVEDFARSYPRALRAQIVEACRSYLAVLPVLTGGRAQQAPTLQRLAHFRILGELGDGSMARVYLAQDERHDRRVALKVLHSHLESSEVLLERFRREAQVIRRVQSPHVVSIFEVGEHEGRHYIAMEWVRGGNLAEELKRAKLAGENVWSVERATELARDLCLGLLAVHEHGIIHRDIKPQNILLDEDGRAKLADFGLAQLVDRRRLTLSGQLQGTPYYMSPEQALARRVDVDHRTDLYSLGVVLYELLTRHRPSEGETSHQVLYAISFKRPRSPRALNPKVPRDLETICLKALEKSPDDRFHDAQDLLGDIERFRRDQPILGRLPSPGLRAWRQVTQHWRAVAAAAVVLVLLLVASWNYLSEQALRASWPRISVESTLDAAGQEVWARRIDPVTTLLEAPQRLGDVPLRDEPMRPGAYRLQLVTADDALAETTIWLEPEDEPPVFRLRPLANDDVPASMLRVEGATIPLVWTADTDDDGAIVPLRLADDVQVLPFLIDAAVVSNGEYLAYLAEHPDAQRPLLWPDADSEAWAARAPNFEQLPLVGLSAWDAQIYARARGARLPSLAEWELAAQGPELWAFPWGNEPGDVLARTNLAAQRPVDLSSRSWEYYNERMRPVRDAHADNVSPFGLLQPLGNTWEFTESPWRDAQHAPLERMQLYTKGPSWLALHDAEVLSIGMHGSQLTQYRLPAPNSGIRCVRSLTPWRNLP